MSKTEIQGVSAPEPALGPGDESSVNENEIAKGAASGNRTSRHGNCALDEDASGRESATLPITVPTRKAIVSINGRDVDAREIDKAA